MKWLMLTLKKSEGKSNLIADTLQERIAHYGNCEVRQLLNRERYNLKDYFRKNVDTHAYDRIILHLCLKTGIEQGRFLRTIPNLVLMEYDAFENYLDYFWLHGQYSRLYRILPWARIIVSGHVLAKKLQQEGFDAVFLPKGYDHRLLKNLRRERDIELGFVGSMEYYLYKKRKAVLEAIARQEKLEIATTPSGQPYMQYLNRIKFFVTANAVFGEYMLKEYEAMACGCVLLAQMQSPEETAALGFRDMEHLVLYRDVDELRERLAYLRSHPQSAARIAATGEKFVTENYNWDKIASQFVKQVQAPLREKRVKRFFGIPLSYPTVAEYRAGRPRAIA